jgi:hypothetical protein
MTTITDIETRLRHRLGLAKTVALGDSRITEAINAGIARAYADGVPGLASRVLLGKTYGDLTATISAHSAGSASITLDTTPEYVFPGDIIKVGSESYLILTVNTSTNVIDVGLPIEAAQTGSVTITRRSVLLPSAGTIYYATTPDTSKRLDPNTRALAEFPTNTGEAKFYVPGYSEGTEESYINLVPAPTSPTMVGIQCHGYKERLETTDTLNIPEAAIDAILERARQSYLGWSGSISKMEATMAGQSAGDTQNQIRSTGAERSARIKK